MLTQPRRDHAKRSYGCAVPFFALGFLITVGVIGFALPEGANPGIALVVIVFFNAPWVLLLIDGAGMMRDADKFDEHTASIDDQYQLDEQGDAIPGPLTHYDYQRGIVWQEWKDSDGYHRHTVRRLTAAEMRENEILTKFGGYGGGSV